MGGQSNVIENKAVMVWFYDGNSSIISMVIENESQTF